MNVKVFLVKFQEALQLDFIKLAKQFCGSFFVWPAREMVTSSGGLIIWLKAWKMTKVDIICAIIAPKAQSMTPQTKYRYRTVISDQVNSLKVPT